MPEPLPHRDGAPLCNRIHLALDFQDLGDFALCLLDIAFDKLYAASVLGLGSFLAIAGTIVTGTLSDYIGREWSATLSIAAYLCGCIAFWALRRAPVR